MGPFIMTLLWLRMRFSVMYLLTEWRDVAMMRGEVKPHGAMWKSLLGIRAVMLKSWSRA